MHIEHIAMYVNDLEKTREFFLKYFNATSNEGYHNKTTDFRSYFLTFDNGARLEIMNKPQMSDEKKALIVLDIFILHSVLEVKRRLICLQKK